jgi:hypothetical protein
MAIPILAAAFTIYILGISTMLFLKPKMMFGEGGEWKEFGVGRGDKRTVFPFWLFSIFWAFISYGIGLVIMSQFAFLAVSAFPEQQPISVQHQMPSISSATPAPQVSTTMPAQQPLAHSFIRPVSSALGIQTDVPGYYVLQPNGTHYIYYGSQPPKL